MSNSLLNYQFFKSYRLPLDENDNVRVNVKSLDTSKSDNDCSVPSINLSGLNFISNKKFMIGEDIHLKISAKKFFNRWDFSLSGKIVRSFINENDSSKIIYGVTLDDKQADDVLNYFLKDFVSRFKKDKIRKHLYKACSLDKKVESKVGVELFSLFQSITKDIYKNGITDFLSDLTSSFNCQDYHIYALNENKKTLDLYKSNSNKDLLKTTEKSNLELSLNNNTMINMSYVNINTEKKELQTILIYPFYNRLQIPIGVIVLSNTLSNKSFDSFAESSIRFISQIISHFFKDHFTNLEREKEDHHIRYDSILGENRTSIELKHNLELLKNMDKNIMVLGENGVNKKEIADYLHYEGKLKNGSIKYFQLTSQENLRLFFNEIIRVKDVGSGSIIIKEVYLLSYDQQQQLYDFLKDKKVRIVTLTSRDIYYLVKVGKFNKKLYFLLNSISVHLPPLRNRTSDIVEMAKLMLEDELSSRKMDNKKFTVESINLMTSYLWPGNIKELRNCIKKGVIKSINSPVVSINITSDQLSDNMTPVKNDTLFNLLKSLSNHTDQSINYKEHIKSIKYFKKNKMIS